MASHNTDRKIDSSNFTRSERLIECYAMVGCSLLEYEKSQSGLGSVLDLSHASTPFPIPIDIKTFFKRSLRNFEQGVSFVPIEILVAYLEDLLDLEVSDETLHIAIPKSKFNSIWISLIGLVCSIIAGLYLVSLGAPLIFSFGVTVLLAFPFGLLLHFAPRDKHVRRIRFAKLLQNEIGRRSGSSGPFVTTPLSSFQGNIFGKASIGSARSIQTFHSLL